MNPRLLIVCAVSIGCHPSEDCSNGNSHDAGQSSLGLNDVSVLLPLPEKEEDAFLISSDARDGALLGLSYFEQIPDLRRLEATNPKAYPRWAVIGVRLDPCFPDVRNQKRAPSQCRKQLRLIAQPLERVQADAGLSAVDSTLHLLFDLEAAEFSTLLSKWRELHAGSSDLAKPLAVSHRIPRADSQNAYALALRDLVREYCGPMQLREVAFMFGRAIGWRFSKFQVSSGQLNPVVPFRDSQTLSQGYSTLAEKSSFDVSPDSPLSIRLEPLSGTNAGELGGEWGLSVSPDEVRSAQEFTLQVEHPESDFHAGTVDCVTCHISTMTRLRSEALGYVIPASASRFVDTSFDLSLTSKRNTQASGKVLRAFGYLGSEPIISQRAVNESAAVANVLNCK